MAENSPTGAATAMAMSMIRKVPTKSGRAPKAPVEPTWSARIAVCGLHWVPNRKSATGMVEKKRRES